MIDPKECVPQIFEAMPDFRERWVEYLEYWEGKSPGICSDLTELSRYVRDRIVQGNHDNLKEVFNLIEKFLQEGTQEIQEAAATCFLENLQHRVDSGEIPGKLFASLLGPESRAYCKAWDQFTGVKTKGLYD